MAQFVITYIGGNPPATPEEGKQHFARYMEWLGSLGDAAVSPMNPFKNTHTVSPDGNTSEGGLTGMSGFTIIEAESMEKALQAASGCPFLEIQGTLEVSELVDMSQKS